MLLMMTRIESMFNLLFSDNFRLEKLKYTRLMFRHYTIIRTSEVNRLKKVTLSKNNTCTDLRNK